MNDYNNIATEFENYGQNAITDIEIGYKNVLKLLGDTKGKKILDYGCGTGKFSIILKNTGAQVAGVDIADKEVAIAKQKYPDTEFFTVKEMEEKLDTDFDAAVLNFVISAIPSQETILNIFKTIRHYLKHNGRLVMMNSNYEKSPERQFLTFAIGKVKQETGHPLEVFLGADRSLKIEDYFYSKTDYTNMLTQAGFTVEQIIEPLAQNSDHPWKDETKYPPFLIISALAKK